MIFVFDVFNQSPKKSYAKYGKCTDQETYVFGNSFSKILRK